ncbi:unnamed protein product [Lepeophtheirus salmonis]|uniref:(salmon louse) hypothetical protein n=1 Tax=Lepeophtheirus salmonis TaxID=72036 RepID=A0A7R8D680_LEPSM|nr:unnamed protein product [Lepeophtheirus salmonis]CAF3038319.1 unnamed protein product [Lepeophtheirus salmonis]
MKRRIPKIIGLEIDTIYCNQPFHINRQHFCTPECLLLNKWALEQILQAPHGRAHQRHGHLLIPIANLHFLLLVLRKKRRSIYPEFPDDNDLLRDRSHRYEEEIEWMRPHDILRGREEPVLHSLQLLKMKNCSEKLFQEIKGFLKKRNYAGIFRFRFWFGFWIEIVVDDRLPVQKAYAKAKGSYELLNHWPPIDGCIELTGGTPERVRNLNQLLTEDAQDADRLFFDVLRALRVGNIVLASPPPKTREDKLRLAEATELGLQVKHIYRVTQVANLGQGRQLIRVKDCSRTTASIWIGAWHPKDARWSHIPDEARRELDSETFHDGGFWMAYGDFLKYFKTLDICHISHNIDTSASFRGRWEADHNAGDDPDYKDPLARCSAIISLMQKRKAHSRAKGMNKIGFKVYKVEDEVEELSRDFFLPPTQRQKPQEGSQNTQHMA